MGGSYNYNLQILSFELIFWDFKNKNDLRDHPLITHRKNLDFQILLFLPYLKVL